MTEAAGSVRAEYQSASGSTRRRALDSAKAGTSGSAHGCLWKLALLALLALVQGERISWLMDSLTM
jgi:hypothetical protein